MIVEIAQGALTADVAGPADGQPVLFLHGFPQTRYTWRHQLPALADAGFRAVAPDQRGYSSGLRPTSVEAYHVDRLVADVVELAELLGSPVHLVGHDWGGQVAWLAAARHPESLLSLTVLSRPHPAAFAAAFNTDPDQADRSKHHRKFDDPATADLLLEDNARRLRRMLSASNVPDADVDGYLRVLGDRAALDAALNWYRAATGSGLRAADTPDVRVPTLYLWGSGDHSVGRTAAEGTAAHVRGQYRLVEVEGGGHFLTDDGSNEQVTRELLGHLHRTST
ncbi:MAG: pimeloyl-ACP methyl ester carboxylesterase [Acidimicrobiales bacterium]|jgi:pimeloyl-ACP methyl ester carboxylesterase